MLIYISTQSGRFSIHQHIDYVVIFDSHLKRSIEIQGEVKAAFLHDLSTLSEKVKEDITFEEKVDRLCLDCFLAG